MIRRRSRVHGESQAGDEQCQFYPFFGLRNELPWQGVVKAFHPFQARLVLFNEHGGPNCDQLGYTRDPASSPTALFALSFLISALKTFPLLSYYYS